MRVHSLSLRSLHPHPPSLAWLHLSMCHWLSNGYHLALLGIIVQDPITYEPYSTNINQESTYLTSHKLYPTADDDTFPNIFRKLVQFHLINISIPSSQGRSSHFKTYGNGLGRGIQFGHNGSRFFSAKTLCLFLWDMRKALFIHSKSILNNE